MAAAVAGMAACGGGGGGAGSCNPGPTASMTIRSTGISPTNVCVALGGQVTFTNSDTAPHHIEFDANACPTVTVPEIAAGSSQQATFPNTTVNCKFHDGNNPAAAFSGTVAVTPNVVSGGY
jgi:plastocyanin